MNPMQLKMTMLRNVDIERDGVYKEFYDAVKRFEFTFPQVVRNQELTGCDNEAIDYTVANLTFTAYAASVYPEPTVFTRKDYLDVIKKLAEVPNGRIAMIGLVIENYPHAVFCAEYLFFNNRGLNRIFDLPAADRPDFLKNEKREDWVIPTDQVEYVRSLAHTAWRTEERSHLDADENEQPEGAPF